MRGTQFEHELIFLAEVDLLNVLTLREVPEMQLASVLFAEQQIGYEAVFEGGGQAPFARDHGVVAEMPPAVVRELLRAAFHFPAAKWIEALRIEHHHAAGRVAFCVAERRDIIV